MTRGRRSRGRPQVLHDNRDRRSSRGRRGRRGRGGATIGSTGLGTVQQFLQEVVAVASVPRRDEGAVDTHREKRREEDKLARPSAHDIADLKNSPRTPQKPSHRAQQSHDLSETQVQASDAPTRITQEMIEDLQELADRARRAYIASTESAEESEREAATQDEVVFLRELISGENSIGVLAGELSDKTPSQLDTGKRRCWVCKIGTHSPNMCMQVQPGKGMTPVCPIHPCVPGHGLDDCPYLLQFLSNPKLLECLY
ncbi:hypothetical protein PG996_012280 [Apiospora saccharicola]|uniref:Uncharacterized protein n=1 Tax=Apiospora saccharicola TaxID=335842 RepID=A0ABR1U248_9PEZI